MRRVLLSISQRKIDIGFFVGCDLYAFDKADEVTGIGHVLAGTPVVVVIDKDVDQPVSFGDIFDFVWHGFRGIFKVDHIRFVHHEWFFLVTRRKPLSGEKQEVDASFVISTRLVSTTLPSASVVLTASEHTGQGTSTKLFASVIERVAGCRGLPCTICVSDTFDT